MTNEKSENKINYKSINDVAEKAPNIRVQHIQEKRKKSRKKKILIGVAITLSLLLVGTGVYAYVFYNSLHKNVDKMHKKLTNRVDENKSNMRIGRLDLSGGQPFSVLLIGVDHDNTQKRKNDVGRSDSMIVMTVNPAVKSVKMLSIPRDTRVPLIGHNDDALDKIAHSYAFGQVEMCVDTVENLMQIPIDFYVKVDMVAFVDIVNALDGIDVVNEREFTLWGETFKKGELHLNGKRALYYSRKRKGASESDWTRQNRQQQVIKAIIDKGLSPTFFVKFGEIFDTLGDEVNTNLTFAQLKVIQSVYRVAAGTMDSLSMEQQGRMINGVWYNVPKEEDIQTLRSTFKDHLELSKYGDNQTSVNEELDRKLFNQ